MTDATLPEVADTAGNLAKFTGDAAKLALTIGNIALPIIEFVLPWIPGVGPLAADIEIALPIIQKVATYAPQVQTAIQQGVPMIEAIGGIGDALLLPLKQLLSQANNVSIDGITLADIETFIGGTFKQSYFTPQDWRFDRAQGTP